VSRKTARLFGSERVMLTRPFEVKGPSGKPVCIEETCSVIFPLGGPHERRLEIPALVVDTLERYCGFLQNSMWKWEMQLGKADAGILPLLQSARPDDHQWGKRTLERVRLSSCGTSRSTWKLLVCKGQQKMETVWLSVVRAWLCPCHRFLQRPRSGWGTQRSQTDGAR
jgi:hypothetical protein